MPSEVNATPGQPLRVLREALLWGFATVGAVCILVTVLAIVFGATPLIFRSGSMSPAIETGALAVAVSTPAGQLATGDIVSVEWADGTRVTHRLVEAAPVGDGSYTLTTRGDANDEADVQTVTVTSADRVVWSVPGVGYVLQEVMKPQYVFVAGVAIGALLVFAFRPPKERPRRRATAAAPAVLVLLLAMIAAPTPVGTMATFTNAGAIGTGTPPGTGVFGTGVFGTGAVTRPSSGSCTAGLLQSVKMSWVNPSGGLTRDHYRVTITLNGSTILVNDSIASTATSFTIPTGILSVGNGTFAVQAVHTSGWTSTAVAGNYSVLGLLLSLNTTCAMTAP